MLQTDLPDAEAQCAELAELIRPQLRPNTALVGIHSGGAWLATRLQTILGGSLPLGTLDISFYRDDFNRIGDNSLGENRVSFYADTGSNDTSYGQTKIWPVAIQAGGQSSRMAS